MTLKVDMYRRVLEYYEVCSNDDPELTLTYFTTRSNVVPYAFVGEKGETMDFKTEGSEKWHDKNHALFSVCQPLSNVSSILTKHYFIKYLSVKQNPPTCLNITTTCSSAYRCIISRY